MPCAATQLLKSAVLAFCGSPQALPGAQQGQLPLQQACRFEQAAAAVCLQCLMRGCRAGWHGHACPAAAGLPAAGLGCPRALCLGGLPAPLPSHGHALLLVVLVHDSRLQLLLQH